MSDPLSTSTWRDPMLAQFTRDIASVARLTVVADPDELLTEQGVVDGIRQRGFEIVPFEDHVAFRYAYERRFREVWDNGNDTNLVVVLRAARSDVSGLPFDLLEQAKRDRRLLSFSLAELFPSLAPHVLSELDRGDLDLQAVGRRIGQPQRLGGERLVVRHLAGQHRNIDVLLLDAGKQFHHHHRQRRQILQFGNDVVDTERRHRALSGPSR